jgi:cyclohexa-1,5-dienecarbonyl-CoA hydratase
VTDAFLVSVARLADGSVARVSLSGGKGNVLTRAAIAELGAVFRELGEERSVHAVLLTAEGSSFCYGASVPEHAPGVVDQMLPEFSGLFRTISAARLPVVAAIRGKCLGGGLELALVAHRIVVAEDAELGFPEVTLGVFPPVAAALLPLRVAQPVVDRLVVLGDIVRGTDAVAMGLADECAPSVAVETRALAWAARYRELSGAAIRFATRASRCVWDEALGKRLDGLERLYLDELMATADAREGIAAFLERRPPRWVDA